MSHPHAHHNPHHHHGHGQAIGGDMSAFPPPGYAPPSLGVALGASPYPPPGTIGPEMAAQWAAYQAPSFAGPWDESAQAMAAYQAPTPPWAMGQAAPPAPAAPVGQGEKTGVWLPLIVGLILGAFAVPAILAPKQKFYVPGGTI